MGDKQFRLSLNKHAVQMHARFLDNDGYPIHPQNSGECVGVGGEVTFTYELREAATAGAEFQFSFGEMRFVEVPFSFENLEIR